MVSVEIPKETEDKIQNFVKLGRFKDLNEFVQQALKLLLYAEEYKEDFLKQAGKK